jgi:hypothetical protein
MFYRRLIARVEKIAVNIINITIELVLESVTLRLFLYKIMTVTCNTICITV